MQTVRTWNGGWRAILTNEQMRELFYEGLLGNYFTGITGQSSRRFNLDEMIHQLNEWFKKQPKKFIPKDLDEQRYQELKTLIDNLGMTEEEVL